MNQSRIISIWYCKNWNDTYFRSMASKIMTKQVIFLLSGSRRVSLWKSWKLSVLSLYNMYLLMILREQENRGRMVMNLIWYNNDASDISSTSDNGKLGCFFLYKNNWSTYAEAPPQLFSANWMITDANILRSILLGVICSKMVSANKHRNISSNKLKLKGLSEIAVVYVKSNITQNNLFQSQHIIDPIAIKAADYQMKSF